MAISKTMREAVYEKYGGHCAYCGRSIKYSEMQVDHFRPRRAYNAEDSGGDDISNLMPACRMCNHYKRANTLETFRRYIEEIPRKLRQNYIYKVGVAYGNVVENEKPIRFYFEEAGPMDEYIKRGAIMGMPELPKQNAGGLLEVAKELENFLSNLQTVADISEANSDNVVKTVNRTASESLNSIAECMSSVARSIVHGAEYIDKNKVVLNYGGLTEIAPNDAAGIAKYFSDQIKAIPAEDVEPVRYGLWAPVYESEISGYDPALGGRDPVGAYVCTNCGAEAIFDCNDQFVLSERCHKCGAYMDAPETPKE